MPDEVEQVIAGVRPGLYQALDRTLIRTAAMTGLRAGELAALRWRDVDWRRRASGLDRATLGEFGTPKSRRSTRSIPMADAVGAALDRHFKGSRWQDDDDLVFAHPATGEPLSKHQNLRRFRAALKAAGRDESHRFHDLRHTFGTQMAAVGRQCGRCRNGWGIATWRPRSATPTMPRAVGTPSSSTPRSG
jgi:integrase